MEKDGKWVWKDKDTYKVSPRWLKVFKEAIEQLNDGDLSISGHLDAPLTISVPKGLDRPALSSALGDFFEYSFWNALQVLALKEQAQVTQGVTSQAGISRGKATNIEKITYSWTMNNGVNVVASAEQSFIDRGLNTSSTYYINSLTIDEKNDIISAAKMAAQSIWAEIETAIKQDQIKTITIDALAGSNTIGDVIIQALNKEGKNIISLPVLELKYYGNDTPTFFTLSDRYNFGTKFSEFLNSKPQVYWSKKLSTETWYDKVSTEGLLDYIRFVSNQKQSKGIFLYLLQKGQGHDISKKRMIAVNSKKGNVTISVDLESLATRQSFKRFSSKNVGYPLVFDSTKNERLGSLRFNDPTRIKDQSMESDNQTKGPGPDWFTTFQFIVNKAYYSAGSTVLTKK